MDDLQKQKRNQINNVSPSFCTAKWLQVTIDLVHGTTHSCHHPQRHAVPLEEIKANPGALHNSEFKKQQRKMMLEGVRPKECSYCWDAEDLGVTYSDRFIKTTDDWAWSDFKKISEMPWDQNVAPRYLEVMIDNLCNFSCAYCMADVSTGVAAELKKFGPYPFHSASHRYWENQERSQHAEFFKSAFQKWFPQIVDQLKVFRVTGGEPLISPSFWWYLEEIRKSKSNSLSLAVNSHFSHRRELVEKFAQEINELFATRKINEFQLYLSLDTQGAQAEYIRHGLSYEKVLENLRLFSQLVPRANFVVMTTFNILSFGQFSGFLKDVTILKANMNLALDVSILKNPVYLRADLATEDLKEKFKGDLDFVRTHEHLFNPHEIGKLENLDQWLSATKNTEEIDQRRMAFFQFVTEYDRRKKKNFRAIFPEYRELLIAAKRSLLLNYPMAPEKINSPQWSVR